MNEAFGLLLLCTLAMGGAWAKLRGGDVPMLLFYLPGTFLHELAHFLVALITFGRPSGFTLFPIREVLSYTKDGRPATVSWTLGQTMVVPHIGTIAPTAVAPLLLAPAAWVVFAYGPHWGWGPWRYLLIYHLFCGAWPSRTDWRIALSHPASFLLWLTLALLLAPFFWFIYTHQAAFVDAIPPWPWF